MKCAWVVLLPVLWAAIASEGWTDERIVIANGRSTYQIVLDRQATKVGRLAAQELQHFVEQASGVKLPIVSQPTEGLDQIFVGPNPASEAAGVRAEGLPAEGFRMKTVGPDIHIVGDDAYRGTLDVERSSATRCGTLSGVYEFLERFARVLFLWHDELGTIVPRLERLAVNDLDVTDGPDWSYRALPYSPEGATQGLFGRRLRLGHAHTVSHSHAWHQILPIDKYGAEHPEYYAEIDGRRQAKHYLGHHGGQVCTSNPEVIEIFARTATEFFNRFPQRDMFSISPNDGGGFCRCAQCRALDAVPHEAGQREPVLTDRLLTFYNAVAERVAKVHPDKLLGAYVYSFYKEPPRRTRPHPSLALFLATNSAHTQGMQWPREQAWEKQWLTLTARLYKYDIYYHGSACLHLIAPLTQHLGERLKSEQAAGMRGGYLYVGQSYEQMGAGHWLMARLMWDQHADVGQLENTYYGALYGAAGEDVLGYYRLLEQRLRKVRLEGVDLAEPAVDAAFRTQNAGGQGGYALAAYWPILDQATALLNQAKGRKLDQLQQRRLERLLDHHELLVWTVRGMIAAGRLEGRSQASQTEAKTLVQAVERRQAVIQRLKNYAPTLVKYLEEADPDELNRMSPRGPFYRLAQGWGLGSPKLIRLPCGTFENLNPEQVSEKLRINLEGGATMELTGHRVQEGKQALCLRIPKEGRVSLQFSAEARPGASYRLMFAHAEKPVEPRDPEACVRTRVIFRDKKGKAVTPTKQYSWNRAELGKEAETWQTSPHLFSAPDGTQALSITFFFHYPGMYWLDNVRLEELGQTQ